MPFIGHPSFLPLEKSSSILSALPNLTANNILTGFFSRVFQNPMGKPKSLQSSEILLLQSILHIWNLLYLLTFDMHKIYILYSIYKLLEGTYKTIALLNPSTIRMPYMKMISTSKRMFLPFSKFVWKYLNLTTTLIRMTPIYHILQKEKQILKLSNFSKSHSTN